jgi:predicted outer membrane protein
VVIRSEHPFGRSSSRSDNRWLAQAAVDSLHEIEAGNLAQTNSSTVEVQAYGALLVQDHTAAYNQAVALAATNGIALPRLKLDLCKVKRGWPDFRALSSMLPF